MDELEQYRQRLRIILEAEKICVFELDGVVCSPHEAAAVKRANGQGFLTVTPGIRFADGSADDQVRIMTPEKARATGTDYIVVGRAVTAAADPQGAYLRCLEAFTGGMNL